MRHGETEWSRAHRHTGRTDLALTAAGEDQARALRDAVAAEEFALTLTSPLRRARRTAELAGLSPQVEPDLVEWDYGELEGRTRADVEAERPGWALWRDGPPGGESLDEFARRVDRVLARVERQTAEDDVVCLVAHGHVLRVLAARWLGLPPQGAELFRLGTAALSELGRDHGRPVIDLWNSTVRGGRTQRPA